MRFNLAGASLIAKVNSKATLTLCFSQLADVSCDASVSNVDIVLAKRTWMANYEIEQLLLFEDTVKVYKCINNLAPKYLCKKFIKRSQFHDHPMRHQDLPNI